jgi:hypothetical protein
MYAARHPWVDQLADQALSRVCSQPNPPLTEDGWAAVTRLDLTLRIGAQLNISSLLPLQLLPPVRAAHGPQGHHAKMDPISHCLGDGGCRSNRCLNRYGRLHYVKLKSDPNGP